MPHKQKRNILRVGDSLGITLPAAWLRYFKLKPKDRVKMVSNNTIIIYPPEPEEKEVSQ